MIASPFRRRSRRRWATHDRALVQDVLSTHHGEQRKGRLTALLGDTEFRVTFEYAGAGEVVLAMDCPCVAAFALSLRRRSDDVLAWLPRLASEPLLDPERFTLEARDVRSVDGALRKDAPLAALQALFDAGAVRVELGHQGLVARFARDELGEGLDKARLLELVEHLDVVRAAFVELSERQPGRTAPGDLPRQLIKLVPVFAWASAAFVAGVTRARAPLVDGHPPEWADLAGAAAWLLLGLGLGAMLLSRRTAPQRALAGPLLALALGALPAGWAAAWWYDVTFDRSDARIVRADVVDLRQVVRGERVLHYRAAVETSALGLEQPAARERLWLQLDGAQGELAKEAGAQLELALQPGALGAPWVRDWRVAPR